VPAAADDAFWKSYTPAGRRQLAAQAGLSANAAKKTWLHISAGDRAKLWQAAKNEQASSVGATNTGTIEQEGEAQDGRTRGGDQDAGDGDARGGGQASEPPSGGDSGLPESGVPIGVDAGGGGQPGSGRVDGDAGPRERDARAVGDDQQAAGDDPGGGEPAGGAGGGRVVSGGDRGGATDRVQPGLIPAGHKHAGLQIKGSYDGVDYVQGDVSNGSTKDKFKKDAIKYLKAVESMLADAGHGLKGTSTKRKTGVTFNAGGDGGIWARRR